MGLCHVNTDQDRRLFREPAHSVAGKKVVDPTKVGIEFLSDTGKVILSPLVAQCLSELQALRMYPEFHVAQLLDPRVQVAIRWEKNKYEVDELHVSEELDRPRYLRDGTRPTGRIFIFGKELVRLKNGGWPGSQVEAFASAFVHKRRNKTK